MTTTTRRPVSPRTDLVGALAELDAATADARLTKPEVVPHTQQAHHHLFSDPGRLSPVVPRPLAARRAAQPGAPVPAAHHRSHHTVDPALASADPGVAALVRRPDPRSRPPALVTPPDPAALEDAGLDADAIVLLSQVVAVTAYEARLVTGLRLLAGHDDGPAPAPSVELPARGKYSPERAPNG